MTTTSQQPRPFGPLLLANRLLRKDIIQSATDHYAGQLKATHLTECERLLILLRMAECRTMLVELDRGEND